MAVASATLPLPELCVYGICWIGYVLYTILIFVQKAFLEFRRNDDLVEVLFERTPYFTGIQDNSDYTWAICKFVLHNHICYLPISLIIGEFLKRKTPDFGRNLSMFHAIFGAVFVVLTLGPVGLILVSFQPLFFVFYTPTDKASIWLAATLNICLLAILKHFLGYQNFSLALNFTLLETYIVLVINFWGIMRCISYTCDIFDSKKPQNVWYFLGYYFYYPLLITGPIVRYETYEKHLETENTQIHPRLLKFTLNLVRYLFWFLVLEISNHFIFVSASCYHYYFLARLELWAFYGFGMTMTVHFYLKYLVMYGVALSVANFEGLKDLPGTPKCLLRIHLYSDLWRYFDVGLYKFLLHYLYHPIRRNIGLPIIPTVLVFVFVYIWHGTELAIFIWTLFNFSGVVGEKIVRFVHEDFLQHTKFVREVIGVEWYRRFACLIAVPVTLMITESGIFFLCGTDVGFLFIRRFILDGGILANLNLVFFVYCMCQISTELKAWEARKNPRISLRINQ